MSVISYHILSVSPDASLAEVKSAYRRLAGVYHPDRNPGDKQAQEMFQMVVGAYQRLIPHVSASASSSPKTTQQACRRKRRGTRSDRRYNWQLPQQYIGTQVNCKV